MSVQLKVDLCLAVLSEKGRNRIYIQYDLNYTIKQNDCDYKYILLFMEISWNVSRDHTSERHVHHFSYSFFPQISKCSKRGFITFKMQGKYKVMLKRG